MTDKEKFQLVESALKQQEQDKLAIAEAEFWIKEMERLERELFFLENSDEKFSPDFNDKLTVVIKNLEAVAANMDLELAYFKNTNKIWDGIEQKLKND